MKISQEMVDIYNTSVSKFDELHLLETAIARKDIEIQDLKRAVASLDKKVQEFTKYNIKGKMLELIELSCEDNEALRESWTDFLMMLKLAVPDIESSFKAITYGLTNL
jgi:hypothetical protein